GLGHSFILFVSVNDSDPVQAVSLVNTICHKYQEFFFEVKGAQNVKAFNFLKRHLKTIEVDMEKTDNKLRDFELKQGKDLLELINMQKGSVAIYDDFSEFLVEYNKQVVELNTAQARLRELKRQMAQEQIKNIPADYMGRGKPVVFIQEKLISIESNLADLKSRYTDEYIPISQAEEKKSRLEKVQQDTMRENLMDEYLQVEMDLVAARERVDSLRKINNQYAGKLDKLINAKTTYSQLMREQTAADKVYVKHMEELENARLTMFSDLSKVANVYILDEATLPVPKIKPKVKVNIILSLVIGLLLGIGLAFFADYLDHTIKSVEDVEYYLKQPILMSLPILAREMKE
ncbi:MAG: GNVR domain-containing protein, partial [Candidatus Auribacterota bacterium]|nr:GNVR domain-containing protein [Candidatus Auribacterota bacterium]